METCLIKTPKQAEKSKLGANIKLPDRKVMVFFMSPVTQICRGVLETIIRSCLCTCQIGCQLDLEDISTPRRWMASDGYVTKIR